MSTATPQRHNLFGVRIAGNGDLQLCDSLGKLRTVATPYDLGLTREQVIARAKTWRPDHMQLPARPAPHHVLGKTSSGKAIRTLDVETVWNDRLFIDGVYGAGTYNRFVNDETREALRLGVMLYASHAAVVSDVGKGLVLVN